MRCAMVGSATRKARAISSRGQAAEQLERQRQPRLGAEHRVAGGEDQAQQVVADLVLARGVERVDEVGHHQRLLRLQVLPDLLELLAQALVAAQPVERAVLRGGHQPRPGLVGHAVARPVLQRGDQRVLRQLLGQADVAHHAAPRAATMRADSMRQTASIARCVASELMQHRPQSLSICRCRRRDHGSAARPDWARSPPARTAAAARSRSRCRPERAAGSGATIPAPPAANAPG